MLHKSKLPDLWQAHACQEMEYTFGDSGAMKCLSDLLDSLDYKHRSFDDGTKVSIGLWQSPAVIIPKPNECVEVITYEGRHRLGKLLADNNWQVSGYPNHLFNSAIALWKYPD